MRGREGGRERERERVVGEGAERERERSRQRLGGGGESELENYDVNFFSTVLQTHSSLVEARSTLNQQRKQ